MAFNLFIYEKDPNLYTLIRIRLSHYYPESYITNPILSPDAHNNLSSFSIVLYDNRQFRTPSELIPDVKAYIELYSEDENSRQIIDCSRLNILIGSALQSDWKTVHMTPVGKVSLLLSYAYINERESFIREYYDTVNTDSEYTIRIDLMSGLRMSTAFNTSYCTTSLTDLIRESGKKEFSSEKILEYLNPDLNGFMTPGKPVSPDDVFDAEFNNVLALLDNLKKLVSDIGIRTDVLVVVEGWKTGDILSMARYCDEFNVLLPSRLCSEEENLEELINSVRRTISRDTPLNIHYCDDYREEFEYESIGI